MPATPGPAFAREATERTRASPFLVILGVALRYDWRKPSDYGLTKAGPAPLWTLVLFIAGLGVVLLVATQLVP